MNSRLTPYVQKLLLINIGLFVLVYVIIGKQTLANQLSLHGVYSDQFAPYQFITGMFMHADFMHLFSNMVGLYFFGPLLEYFLGAKKFLILYLVCGIGAAFIYWGLNAYQVHAIQEDAAYYIAHSNPDLFSIFIQDHYPQGYDNYLQLIDAYSDNPQYVTQTQEEVQKIAAAHANFTLLGASGAVFGILMAFALLFPNTEMILLFPPIPIKAKFLVAGYAAFEIYSMYANRPGDNVAHLAHIAGMIFAFILVRYWKTKRNSFY